MGETMRLKAIGLACLVSACASTYAPNPNDPVDMAAELGNRGRHYVAMGAVCDAVAGGQYRRTVSDSVRVQQQRLGVLSSLVERAHRGQASPALLASMQDQMRQRGLSAAEYCADMLRQAELETAQRASRILAMTPYTNTMDLARQTQEPTF